MKDGSDSRVHEEGPMQGRVTDVPPPGTTPSHARATFSDPVPGNMDPTEPQSPENTMPYDREHVANDGARMRPDAEAPQDNLEQWRVVDSDPQT